MYGALGGVLFLLPIQLHQVSGYTALQAGISLLPLTAMTLALSARSGALAARIGPRLQMSVGPCLVGLGLDAVASGSTPLAHYLDRRCCPPCWSSASAWPPPSLH